MKRPLRKTPAPATLPPVSPENTDPENEVKQIADAPAEPQSEPEPEVKAEGYGRGGVFRSIGGGKRVKIT